MENQGELIIEITVKNKNKNQSVIEWQQGVLPKIDKHESDFVLVARKMNDSYVYEFGTLNTNDNDEMWWELETDDHYPVEDVIAWAEQPALPQHILEQLEDIAADETADIERKQREKAEVEAEWARLYDVMYPDSTRDTKTKAQKAKEMLTEATKMLSENK